MIRYATCCPEAASWCRAGILMQSDRDGWMLTIPSWSGARYRTDRTTIRFCPWCGTRLPEVTR